MRIYPIQNNNVYFSANNREVYNADNKFQYKTTTYFFRADTDWDALGNYLCEKYADTDKVNVICHACSNGMEPYSFLMQMTAFHPLEINKFTPIIAKDINSENIEMAAKNIYDLSDTDASLLDYYTKGLYKFYMDNAFVKGIPPNLTCSMSDKFKKYVNFEQGDILKDIESIPRKNTVLFCKNLWPYLPVEQQEFLVKKFAERFDDSCVIITGDFDKRLSKVNPLMIEHGFSRHPKMLYVYEKHKQ